MKEQVVQEARQKVAESQSSVMRGQYENEQKRVQGSIKREELRVLVEEYLANGGTITQCPSRAAYDLRATNVRSLRERAAVKRTNSPAVLYKKSA